MSTRVLKESRSAHLRQGARQDRAQLAGVPTGAGWLRNRPISVASPSGSPAQDTAQIEWGTQVFSDQRCSLCHSIAGTGRKKGELDAVGSKLTGALGLLEEIGRHPDAARPIIAGTQYRFCELELAARSEMIVTLDDFLRRRTKIAQIISRADLRQADGLLRACKILFGADAQERYDEYFAGATTENAGMM
jgi:hypothetical protein